MGLDSGLTWSIVYELYLWYCVGGYGGNHEVTNSFTKAADSNPDVLGEGIARKSPNDHDCFRGYSC